MKLKTLLLISGGALAASSANAALNVVERQLVLLDPAKADLKIDGATKFYLYNPGTQGFALGANNYYTRASVSQGEGYMWKAALEDADQNLVSLNDSVERDNSGKACTWGWRKMFTDNAQAVYVDNNNGANANSWQIIANGDGSFRISNVAVLGENSETLYLGALTGETVCNLYAEGTEGANLDWYAVSVDDYKKLAEARGSVIEKFNAAVPLLAMLKEADAAGVPNLAQYEAIYANEESTVDELNEAVVAVKKAITDYLAGQATAESPVDLSANIVNADFANNNATGWSGTGLAFQSYADAEHYNKTYNTYQEIKDIPNGVYALTAQAYYRAGFSDASYDNFVKDAEHNAKLYAINKVAEEGKSDTLSSSIVNVFEGITADDSLGGDESKVEKDGVTYYVPNNMATAKTYFDAGYYNDNQVLFAVSENTAVIGVKKDRTVNGDWSIFNNFGLKYYGEGADAYKLWNADLIKNVKTYSESDQITKSVLAAYNEVLANSGAGTTYEEVTANMKAINDAQKDISDNATAWENYLTEVAAAQIVADDENYSGPDVEDLADYLDETAKKIRRAKALSTEEINAETANLKKMKENAIQNSIKAGADMTKLLSDPDFSQGGKGWTKKSVSGGNVAFNASAKCAEGWNNADFDIYQTVENAPVGAYKISVQGFYRRGRGDNAWKLYFEQGGNAIESPAYAYCNDMKTPLSNVFEYGVPVAENYYVDDKLNVLDVYKSSDDYYYPNDMKTAGLAFDRGHYTIETYGLVAQKGDALRIGMKGNTTQENDSWAIFTRFKLTFMGDDVDILKSSIEKTIDGVKLEQVMGTDVKAELTAAITAAQQAANGTDGKEMRLKLNDLLQAINKVDASVSLFTSLQTSAEDFSAFLGTVEGYPELVAEASTYVESLDVENMTDAEANAAIAKIAEYRHQLSLPVGWENATDDAPVDMTSLLASPSFEKEGVNSIDGWQNTTGYNFGNNDTQKAALALEFYDKNFDLYQDVEVPNGTYQVTAMAFNRAGNLDADVAAVAAGTASKALLYAKSGENEVTKPIEHIATVENFGASSEKLGQGDEKSFTGADGNTYNVPNDMVSSVAYFEQGRYYNGVTIKVTDGKLRLGIRQADKVSGSWVIMDDFKLTYFGTDSKKEEGGFTEVDAIELAPEVAKVEVYSVNGMKLNAMQKGVNILVITDKDGNVTTKTVIK